MSAIVSRMGRRLRFGTGLFAAITLAYFSDPAAAQLLSPTTPSTQSPLSSAPAQSPSAFISAVAASGRRVTAPIPTPGASAPPIW